MEIKTLINIVLTLNFKKMKRFFIRLSAIAIMIGLCSCGAKQEELTKTIPASDVKITGDCSNFFTISDDAVKILLTKVRESEYGWEVRAVIPLSKTPEAKSWSELKALPHIKKPYYAGMMGFSGIDPIVKLLDANGTEIDLNLYTAGINEFLNSEDMSENIAFKYRHSSDQSDYEKTKAKYDKVVGIKIIMDLSFDEQFSDEEPVVDKNKSKTSSNKLDALLDDYEQYVDKYIKFYKKAMNGDMSAMSEYVDLLEKAETLSEELNNARNDMTSTQMNRYLKITNKMSEAIINE